MLWLAEADYVPIMFRMASPDPSFRDALAYGLWRSAWRTRLGGLDHCRLAADDIVRHLTRAGYTVHPGEPLVPHSELSRGAQIDPAEDRD